MRQALEDLLGVLPAGRPIGQGWVFGGAFRKDSVLELHFRRGEESFVVWLAHEGAAQAWYRRIGPLLIGYSGTFSTETGRLLDRLVETALRRERRNPGRIERVASGLLDKAIAPVGRER